MIFTITVVNAVPSGVLEFIYHFLKSDPKNPFLERQRVVSYLLHLSEMFSEFL